MCAGLWRRFVLAQSWTGGLDVLRVCGWALRAISTPGSIPSSTGSLKCAIAPILDFAAPAHLYNSHLIIENADVSYCGAYDDASELLAATSDGSLSVHRRGLVPPFIITIDCSLEFVIGLVGGDCC